MLSKVEWPSDLFLLPNLDVREDFYTRLQKFLKNISAISIEQSKLPRK